MEYRLRRHDAEYRWVLDIGVPRFDQDRVFVGYIGICVDVTEPKRTEEALQHKEMELTEAQRLAGVGSWQWDARVDKVIWSEELYRLVGRDPKLPAPSFKEHPSLFTAESWERLQGVVKEALQTGAPYELDIEILSPESTTKWAIARGEPLRDAGDQIIGLRGTVQDITARKQAEEALRESEEQFRTLAEAIPQLCWMARGNGHIFWYNQRWYTYTGTTAEQMEGWGWQSVHDLQTLPKVLERWKASISTAEPFDMVFPLRGADGVFRSFLTRVMPIKDAEGRVVRWFGTNTDITKLRDAQEALRTSEERLRMGQWAAHIGTFEWIIRTGVSIWTPELEAMYGLPLGGFGGTKTAFENLVHPDDRSRVIDLIDEAVKTGQPTEGEWRVVWPDGSLHWIAARGQVFLNESGEPSRMFGVHLDVTERKQAEEVLSGMTRKLVEAQEQERARIARELHDDITQRLAMLAIEIEQLQEHPETPSKVRDRADELSRRTKEISTDVQALSHELHSSKLDYLGIVGGMKSWCSEFGERQGMEIEFKSSGLPNSLPSETSLCLFRVLQEALHNAAKYSGVKRVDVQLREESCEIHLIVSDLGKGFDVASAMQDRGLGVTSMQERVRLVGGTIVIDSKPLGGTTIHVRVPLAAERNFQRAARVR